MIGFVLLSTRPEHYNPFQAKSAAFVSSVGVTGLVPAGRSSPSKWDRPVPFFERTKRRDEWLPQTMASVEAYARRAHPWQKDMAEVETRRA
jgi:hypothetical protein